MKFLFALFGVAAITSYAMAAPAEDMKDVKEAKEGTEAVDKAQVDNWDWCAPDFTCDSNAVYHDGGCYSQPDCRAKARDGDTIRSFGCGAGFHPLTCWVYTD
ncbi:uncharacterized protein BDW47DRAFT_123811 [Aspergillus candidus]|uniref:Uncharacterized protein n=1 Tax=Aspergillus candidus TaxID=41067 RepID=A0A2I2FI70_ASPCN|nr:hypothetical protein BDW47DRAFT_123811 [Aspergillus candidus]PLB40314.1 hypothetical protein BDW47DRAFT_123811 [Aspergillus candidus]